MYCSFRVLTEAIKACIHELISIVFITGMIIVTLLTIYAVTVKVG